MELPLALPMLTTFLATVTLFAMPYALFNAPTVPLLMLFKRVMFTPSLLNLTTQNMPHASFISAETEPLFSLLSTMNNTSDVLVYAAMLPIKPPASLFPKILPLLEKLEMNTFICISLTAPISPPSQ